MSLGGFVSHHRGPVLLGAVVVGIAVVVVFSVRNSSDKGSPSPTTGHAGTTVALSGPAGELAKLLEHGRSVDVDAAYRGSVGDNGGLQYGTHLWRRGRLARLDTDTGSGEKTNNGAQVVTPKGSFSCTQKATAPWSCTPKPDLVAADLGVVSPQLVTTLSNMNGSVRDDNIGGEHVRCFTFTPPAPPSSSTPGASPAPTGGEVCVAADGIPLRVTAGPTRLEASSVKRGPPPESAFNLPTSP